MDHSFFIIIPAGDPLLSSRAPFTRQGCLPPGAQLSQACKSTTKSWHHAARLQRPKSHSNSLVKAALTLSCILRVRFLLCLFLPSLASAPYASTSGERYRGYTWLRKQLPPFSCAGLEYSLCNFRMVARSILPKFHLWLFSGKATGLVENEA